MASLCVLLADDHDIVRKGLRKIIEGQPGWRIVADVNNGRAAVEQANQFEADIAILDIGMPLLNGLEAARQISKTGSQTKILILTMHESEALIQQVLETGARGYLLKSDAVRDLVPAIEALSQNKTFFTSKVAQMVLDGYLGKSKEISNEIDSLPLTARQREIVQLVAEGKSSREVALQLGVALKTIETHRANLMRRLGCHTVAELVRYAVRNKIVTL
jgi:DNA-binding NarL/FixJ family response regulator